MSSPNKKQFNIAIVWDFDKTLTPVDSTSELIKIFLKKSETSIKDFWTEVKEISRTKTDRPVESISTSDAPVWMYMLSVIALNPDKTSFNLNKENIKKIIAHEIELYPEVPNFLKKTKNFSKQNIYQKNNIKIYHFIITAGLKDLVASVFEYQKSFDLIEEIFGCKYHQVKNESSEITNVPIYCMDKTSKTRALFEINKGCFLGNAQHTVDDLVAKEEEWCPFENIIYIGDGDTDIPAFSLVKSRNGMTIGVYNPKLSQKEINRSSENMRKGRRIDLFTPACFEAKGELYKFINMRCQQIAKRYDAYL